MIDIPRAADNFRFFAKTIRAGHSERINHIKKNGKDATSYTHRQPVGSQIKMLSKIEYWLNYIGVAGLISPWNLPLYLLTWKIAPAIAFGNTCVAKPSEMTSLTAYELCKIIKQVVNEILVKNFYLIWYSIKLLWNNIKMKLIITYYRKKCESVKNWKFWVSTRKFDNRVIRA